MFFNSFLNVISLVVTDVWVDEFFLLKIRMNMRIPIFKRTAFIYEFNSARNCGNSLLQLSKSPFSTLSAISSHNDLMFA